MSYASESDLVDRFGADELIRLTNPDDLQATTIDSARLDRAIADASAKVDGYIGSRYEVPLSTVPRVIVTLTCDLARYSLYDDQATEQIRERQKDAMRFLEAVSTGKVDLGPAAGGGRAKTADTASMESGGRTFGRGGDGEGFL